MITDTTVNLAEIALIKINLREFYPWYTQDEFVDMPDFIAAELFADKRYQNAHERVMRRFNVHSLDAGDGTDEKAAIVCNNSNPERIFAMIENHCCLCYALNSLPDIQGRRVEARYLLDKNIKEIAAENVSESAVKESIDRGLKTMRKNYFKNFSKQPCETPDFCPDI